jgi:hypothetical protein
VIEYGLGKLNCIGASNIGFSNDPG